jgi:hypothetical protein
MNPRIETRSMKKKRLKTELGTKSNMNPAICFEYNLIS